MEVTVVDVSTNRSVKLDVTPSHTVGSVLETVVSGLGLPDDRAYALVRGGRELGPDVYSAQLQSLGVSEGDQFDLISRPIGGNL